MMDYRYRDQLHLHPWPSMSPVDAKLDASEYRSGLLNSVLHQSPDYPSSPLSPYPSSSEHSHPIPDARSLFDPPPQNFLPDHSHEYSAAPAICAPDDVLLYVGKDRYPFLLNAQSLISGSAYFRKLLQHLHSPPSPTSHKQSGGGIGQIPIAIDCQVRIFESLLLLMRYGSFDALPPMSASEIFRLKKEAEFYGIQYAEPSSKSRAAVESGSDDHSDMCSVRSQSSSSSGSHKSTMSMSPLGPDKCAPGRHEGVHLSHSTPQRLSDLPEFPQDLADRARLVLISCLDHERASIYTCDCSTSCNNAVRKSGASSTQWALNFHHRHAFCTSCGQPPSLSPKHFAEMFMAASEQYYAPSSSAGRRSPRDASIGWQVSSDSTCMLRFVSSTGDGRDSCGCSAGGRRAGKEAQPTIWAANCFYGHAFCTCCGEVAKGPVLLGIILAVRYGRSHKFSRSARSSVR